MPLFLTYGLKAIFAAIILVFVAWLSGKKPHLAGFITALPIVSMLAIAYSYLDHKDLATTASYARSIILAVPASWLFFAPFFFAEKWNLGFWVSYLLGFALLILGYFIHQYLIKALNV
jgi:hypothetical protein